MDGANLSPYLSHPAVQAFLRVIREGESCQEDRAYFMRYTPHGAAYVDSLAAGHPRIPELTPTGKTSTAFGAYQFVARTWDGINRLYGLADDISRASQDLHALCLLADCGALPLILRGDFDGAVERAATQWASLPDSPLNDGGSKLSYARARRLWDAYTAAALPSPPIPAPTPSAPVPAPSEPVLPPPPAPEPMPGVGESGSYPDNSQPIEDKKMAPALLIALGKSLLDLLPAFGSGTARSNRNIEITEDVAKALLDAAAKVVGPTVNEQAAVDAIRSDDKLRERFIGYTAVNWAEIGPLFEADEKSRGAARTFALDATATGPMWRQIGFGFLLAMMALGIVIGGGAVMGWMLFEANIDAAVRLTILDYYKAIGYIVVGWAFGSSATSKQKNDIIAKQAGVQ